MTRAVRWLLFGFIITAASGLLSTGIYHEDDLKHFLFARWSQHDGRYLLDYWGRPGFTVPYALPAMIGSPTVGWHACRLLSASFTAATAWLAYAIARRLRLRHAWLAIPLVYLQPLLVHLSLTTLTETPLAFYLALATWLLLTRRPIASAAIIALAPVTRAEAIVLLPIWAVALWRSRAHWSAYPLLLWALALQNLLAAIWLDKLPVAAFFEPDGSTSYGHGTPLTFVPRIMLSAGPVVVAAAIVGARRLLTRRDGWLVIAGVTCYFAAETALYMRGAYSSGGYARFLVPIAPWLAVLAAASAQPMVLTRRPLIQLKAIFCCGLVLTNLWALCIIEWWIRPPAITPQWYQIVAIARIGAACFCLGLLAALIVLWQKRDAFRESRAWRLVQVSAAALLLAMPIAAALPRRTLPQHRLMRDAAGAIREHGWDDRPLIAVNYWMYYWTDRWLPNRIDPWDEMINAAEPGTLFAWDRRFCLEVDTWLTYETMHAGPDWESIWASLPDDGESVPFLVLFERRAAAASAPANAD